MMPPDLPPRDLDAPDPRPPADRLLITRADVEAAHARHFPPVFSGRADAMAARIEAATAQIAADLGIPRRAFSWVEARGRELNMGPAAPGAWPLSNPGPVIEAWGVLCPLARA